jgi:hypothetical protein
MPAPITLETLADDIALMRLELRAAGETLARLDNGCAALAERLIALRDENLDAAGAVRDVRREILAHNQLQQKIGERLALLERRRRMSPRPPTDPAFGWTADEFPRAYHQANREEAGARVLEDNPVAEAVIDFAAQAASGWKPLKRADGTLDWGQRVWKDTTTALLAKLRELAPEDITHERNWPKDSTRLSGSLRRVAPALRTKGIKLDFGRERERLADGAKGNARRVISIIANLRAPARA